MVPGSYQHDIYDDTGAVNSGQALQRQQQHPNAVRESRRQHPHAAFDPIDMEGAMQRFQEETERSLGAWGFGSLFGDAPGRGGGIFSSFDRMFDDAFASMGNVANGQGGGQYFYESHTRTVGPDGQVHEEHVRTTPDENGNPRTSRTVRDGEERGSVWRGLRSPFEQDMPGMIGGRHHEDDVIVEELDCSDDEDERWGEYQGQLPRNRYERRDVDVMEEDDTRPSQHPGEWVRQRYNRWMNRA